MLKTDFFWTDAAQAEERLRGSYILYGDSAVYVERIANSRSAGLKAEVTIFPEGKAGNISLSDPLFHRFRKPLPTGWVNNLYSKRAYFLQRSPQRSRVHGMTSGSTAVYTILSDGRMRPSDEMRFDVVVRDQQYQEAIRGDYPALELILDRLKIGTCIAFSNNMALFRDTDGVRWLYIGNDKVGLFTGSDTLLLLSSFSYVKEQLTEAAEFTVNNIVEF